MKLKDNQKGTMKLKLIKKEDENDETKVGVSILEERDGSIALRAGGEYGDEWYLLYVKIVDGKVVVELCSDIDDHTFETDKDGYIKTINE